MSLQSLQQQFISLLLNVKEDKVGVGQALIPMSRLEVKDSLSIYKNNNRQSLLSALEQIYPLCLTLVGSAFFKAMARSFIQEYPSDQYLLEYYGEKLPGFIAKFPHAEGLPYLADVAKLEWCMHLAMIGGDPKALDLTKLQQTPQEKQADIIWFLLENASLLNLSYSVDELWRWHQRGQDTENFELEEQDIFLFVGRGHEGLIVDRLLPAEFTALQELEKCMPFSDICQHLLTIDASTNMIEILPNFIRRGFIDYFGFKHT